jgi:hypothetical protein
MSEPYPDPSQTGAPNRSDDVEIPGRVFKWAWWCLITIALLVVTLVIGFQVFG